MQSSRLGELLFRNNLISKEQLAKALEVEIVNVSHHLGILQRSGFTERRREGRHIIYHLVDGVLEAGRGGASDQRINLGCCQVVVPKSLR